MADLGMEAAIIFEPFLPNALRRALDYAGDDGFVASMPQLLHARVEADYDNIIWNTWFTSNTEESVVTTPAGNRVIVAVHGGGIYATPERFEKTHRATAHDAAGKSCCRNGSRWRHIRFAGTIRETIPCEHESLQRGGLYRAVCR